VSAILLGIGAWLVLGALVLVAAGLLMGQRPECSLCGTDECLYPSPAGEELLCRRCRLIQSEVKGDHHAA
jgi:hypothetical protein